MNQLLNIGDSTASLLRPLKDQYGSILYIKGGTKGGRPRYLRITSIKQRELLERIAGHMG